MTNLDLNTAGEQRTFEIIPAGTICTLQLTIRPGGVGDDGYLTRAKDGASDGLDCEFIVVDGPYAKRHLWQRFTLHGTTSKHGQAGEISCITLRAIVESARGIRPDDKSEEAQAKRKPASWRELDGLRFIARIGVKRPENGFEVKNIITEVITPERKGWTQPEQVQSGMGSTAAAGTPEPAAQPANAIARPDWAKKD